MLTASGTPAGEPGEKPAKPAKESEWVTKDEAGVKVLIRYLKEEKEPIVLLTSLETLASMGARAKPAVPTIVEHLKHAQVWVRIAAARTLIDLNEDTDKAVQTLSNELKSKDAKARAYAVREYGEIANPPFEWPSCWGPDPRPRVFRPEFGKKAVPILVAALKDTDPSVRRNAAASLGRIDSSVPSAVPDLVKVLCDSDGEVRLEAAQALLQFNVATDAAFRALSDGMKSKDAALRQRTIVTMESLTSGDPFESIPSRPAVGKRAVPLLIEAVRKDEDPEIRRRVALFLGRIGRDARSAMTALVDALEDKDSWVRGAARHAIADIVEAITRQADARK
jgi:HEAT repeat protein